MEESILACGKYKSRMCDTIRFAQGVEDKKYPHGIAALPWIRISCGNRVHNCTRALVGVEMQGVWRSYVDG